MSGRTVGLSASSCPARGFPQSCSLVGHYPTCITARTFSFPGTGLGICPCWILWGFCQLIPLACLGLSEWKLCLQMCWLVWSYLQIFKRVHSVSSVSLTETLNNNKKRCQDVSLQYSNSGWRAAMNHYPLSLTQQSVLHSTGSPSSQIITSQLRYQMLPEEGGGIEIYAKNKTGSIYCIFSYSLILSFHPRRQVRLIQHDLPLLNLFWLLQIIIISLCPGMSFRSSTCSMSFPETQVKPASL